MRASPPFKNLSVSHKRRVEITNTEEQFSTYLHYTFCHQAEDKAHLDSYS